jgi:hypothetical protein
MITSYTQLDQKMLEAVDIFMYNPCKRHLYPLDKISSLIPCG